MPLLSNLVNADTPSDPLVYDIDTDIEMLTPPVGLEKVGLLFKGGERNIDDNLVDVIMSFALSGIDVIVEIDVDARVEPDYLMKVASNADFSVSILPPKDKQRIGEWVAKCVEYTEAFLTTPNFSRELYPVSGYFGYLLVSSTSNVEAMTANDDYTLKRFVDDLSDEDVSHMKKAVQDKIFELFGGEEDFRKFAQSFVNQTVTTGLEFIHDVMEEKRHKGENGECISPSTSG